MASVVHTGKKWRVVCKAVALKYHRHPVMFWAPQQRGLWFSLGQPRRFGFFEAFSTKEDALEFIWKRSAA